MLMVAIISVQSQLGRGTTFEIRLPVHAPTSSPKIPSENNNASGILRPLYSLLQFSHRPFRHRIPHDTFSV